MADRIVVVAAVIEERGQFLVTRRLDGTHLAGYWEFPGGKLDEGETHEQALAREISEELGAKITAAREIYRTSHDYPERRIDLHFFRVELEGKPVPVLGQELRWVARAQLRSLQFPPADAELIDQLIHSRA